MLITADNLKVIHFHSFLFISKKMHIPKHVSVPVPQEEPPAPAPVAFTEPEPEVIPSRREVDEPMEQEETANAVLEVTPEPASQVFSLNLSCISS